MAEKSKVALIIFDLDGTLVDSKKDIVNAVNFTLKRIGLKVKPSPEIASYIGTGVEDLIRKSLGEDSGRIFKEALGIFIRYIKEHALDYTVLYPNVKDILEHFRYKKKAIVTNRRYDIAEVVVKGLGIFGYFDGIMGGDAISCMKPSSCPLDMVIEKLGVSDRKKIIMVGDMAIDVLTGKNAGVNTCAVTYGIGKREDIIKAKPDYIIDDIAELKDVIS